MQASAPRVVHRNTNDLTWTSCYICIYYIYCCLWVTSHLNRCIMQREFNQPNIQYHVRDLLVRYGTPCQCRALSAKDVRLKFADASLKFERFSHSSFYIFLKPNKWFHGQTLVIISFWKRSVNDEWSTFVQPFLNFIKVRRRASSQFLIHPFHTFAHAGFCLLQHIHTSTSHLYSKREVQNERFLLLLRFSGCYEPNHGRFLVFL